MGRVGRKRSDRRWRDPDGNVWASKFEWEVYEHFRSSGANVRKCDDSDAISYSEPKPSVRCLECGSRQCVQDRIYTPDLFVVPQSGGEANGGGYYVEAKGYFRPEKRKLFRDMRKARPDINLRVVLEANGWVTQGKTRYTDYFARYLKTTPVCVGTRNIPEEWL